MKPGRYIPEDAVYDEFALCIPGPDDDIVWCTDCPEWREVALEDVERHDAWHVERAAALDPGQGSLL